jgi:uncharacterized paraquat-inducible protein A
VKFDNGNKGVTRYYQHKKATKTMKMKRKCLLCDLVFISEGNRRCNNCNRNIKCEHENNISDYLRY